MLYQVGWIHSPFHVHIRVVINELSQEFIHGLGTSNKMNVRLEIRLQLNSEEWKSLGVFSRHEPEFFCYRCRRQKGQDQRGREGAEHSKLIFVISAYFVHVKATLHESLNCAMMLARPIRIQPDFSKLIADANQTSLLPPIL